MNIGIDYSVDTLIEGVQLGGESYYEVEKKGEKYPYKPNYLTFLALLQGNFLVPIAARNDEGKLIGYFLTLVIEDMATQEQTATMLSTYIEKEYRGSSLFYRMFKLMESTCKERGVIEIKIGLRKEKDFSMMERLGYVETERTYHIVL